MEIVAFLQNNVPYLMEIVYSLITIVVAYLANRLIFQRIIRKFAERANIEEHYTKPFRKVASTIVYVAAILIILSVFGLKSSLTSLLAGAGFLGIVVGMATKDVLSGVIAGMVLYIDRPFKIGDWIEVGDEQGIVQDLSLQTTRIRNFSGELVTVPNSKITNSTVINKTAEPNSRIDIEIGVDYDTDMNKALKASREVLGDEEDVLEEPEPSIVIDEFADSSINLLVRFWVDRKDLKDRNMSLPGMRSNIRKRLLEKFREEGIEIPFPHLEIIKKDS